VRRALVLLAILLAAGAASGATTGIHHDLEVRLDPDAHRIEVRDHLRLGESPPPEGGRRFLLHAGLEPRVEGAGWRLVRAEGRVDATFLGLNATSETVAADVPLEGWRLIAGKDAGGEVVLHYGGVIDHPLATSGEEYQRSFSETPGLIAPEGVFLAGTTFWVPTFGDGLVTFSLAVDRLPTGWDAVSQGRRVRHELDAEGRRSTTWSCPDPSEEIYLVAGPWHERDQRSGKVDLLALLRSDDAGLAERYLAATVRYLRMYAGILPPYPYPSFALVENFWETGYGMPGFTLLGPKIIRMPWILTSSYPHELVHNWWGNSVYVDYASGNWCEGLTAYMADHLFAEQRGEGALYRRTTLQKYADFVASGSEPALVDFRARHSAASEAIGYGKSLMVFHMMRRAVGDEAFVAALGRFWREHRFERASWRDLAAAFSAVTDRDWGPFVSAWTERPGAPQIELGAVFLRRDLTGPEPWQVEVELHQTQKDDPFPVSIPVAVTVEGARDPVTATAADCGRDCRVVIACPAKPLRIDVDPDFDVMRRLDPLEVPPALSTLFGASDPLYVLPAAAPEAERTAWRELAAGWARPGQPRTALDADLDALPPGPVWVLGADNRFAATVAKALADQGVALGPEALEVDGTRVPRGGHSLVLVARSAGDPTAAVGWVAADPAAAIPGLGRKLPHYTRYGWLTFTGDEPTNVGKGLWTPVGSPLVRNLGEGPLPALHEPARKPLAELPPVFDGEALARTVAVLAAPDMDGRGLGSEGLARATSWVAARLAEAGLQPAGDDGFRQGWRTTAGDPAREMVLDNLLARVPGSDPALADHPVLVTAHLDHLGHGWPDVRAGNQGLVHPGADDNASGVAVLLALATELAAQPPRPRPVLFAVTTGEEAGLLGARHLLAGLAPDRLPSACVNLDTVGRLGDGKILVLDAGSAREWRYLWMGVAATTGAPIAVATEQLDSSDQGACLALGVPAVQLTTGPTVDYHRPSDTADKIDAAGLATVAETAMEAVAYLAERREPLTATITGQGAGAAAAPAARGGPRRASLGTVPDFAFQGPGVRVDQVLPGSPAETAGIRAGDVVVALGGRTVDTLRAYSDALKAHRPGEKVTVTLRRDGAEVTVEATLGER